MGDRERAAAGLGRVQDRQKWKKEHLLTRELMQTARAAAVVQGGACFTLLCAHCVCPKLLNGVLGLRLERPLYWNVCYGTAAMLYNRPAMTRLTQPYRLAFSIAGGWMWSHGALAAISYLAERNCNRPVCGLLTCLAAGRAMRALLLTYLHFVDAAHVPTGRFIPPPRNPTLLDFLY